MQILRVLTAILGGIVVVLTASSVLRALVVPRGRSGRLQRSADRWVDGLFRLLTSRVESYEARDRVLAVQAPLYLAALLALWLTLYLFGFGFLDWPFTHDLGRSLRESGSSLLTLGFASTASPGPTVIDLLCGAAGLGTVALQIGYLPTLYSAFNRRETEVTLLGARAGNPPFGPELLARTRIGLSAEEEIDELYRGWERWAADIAESHSNYPALLRFRSPQPYSNWVVALLAVLDSAAMFHALAPSRAPVSARLAIRMGFTALQQIAGAIGLAFNADPRPDDPVALTYEEFASAARQLQQIGFEVEREPPEAWPHFVGWRVNYEGIAYELASRLEVVPVYWSGPRRRPMPAMGPLRPTVRTPTDPEGRSIPRRWDPDVQ